MVHTKEGVDSTGSPGGSCLPLQWIHSDLRENTESSWVSFSPTLKWGWGTTPPLVKKLLSLLLYPIAQHSYPHHFNSHLPFYLVTLHSTESSLLSETSSYAPFYLQHVIQNRCLGCTWEGKKRGDSRRERK